MEIPIAFKLVIGFLIILTTFTLVVIFMVRQGLRPSPFVKQFSGTLDNVDGLPENVAITYENSSVKPKVTNTNLGTEITFGREGYAIISDRFENGYLTWTMNELKIKVQFKK